MGPQLLTQALAAAARGLAVLPLSRSKLPAIRSPHPAGTHHGCWGECGLAGHGVHDASTDPETIRTLFTAAPWATGYGIACGRPGLHLIGIDLDTKHGTDSLAALDRLARAHDFAVPETVTVRGTYWLAPGSQARAPAPVPPALLRILTPPPTAARRGIGQGSGGTAEGRDDAPTRFVGAARSGQQNVRLFQPAAGSICGLSRTASASSTVTRSTRAPS